MNKERIIFVLGPVEELENVKAMGNMPVVSKG